MAKPLCRRSRPLPNAPHLIAAQRRNPTHTANAKKTTAQHKPTPIPKLPHFGGRAASAWLAAGADCGRVHLQRAGGVDAAQRTNPPNSRVDTPLPRFRFSCLAAAPACPAESPAPAPTLSKRYAARATAASPQKGQGFAENPLCRRCHGSCCLSAHGGANVGQGSKYKNPGKRA